MPYELLPENKGKQQKYEMMPNAQQDESFLSSLGKGALQTGARVGETILGTPGNILSAGHGALNYLSTKIGAPEPVRTYEEIQEHLPISFPTSHQIREFGKKHLPEYSEPTSKLGKKYNSAVETVTSLVTPLSSVSKGLSFGKAIRGALSGEVLSSIAESLGGSDTTQAVAKTLGVLGGTIGFNGRELNKIYDKNYKKFEKIVNGKEIKAPELLGQIEQLEQKWLTGDSPAREFAQKRIEALRRTLKGDRIDAGELWRLKKDANKHFLKADSSERQVLHDIIDLEKNTLRKLGSDYKILETADDIHSSFKAANKATSWINKHAPALTYSPLIKGLFGLGAYGTNKIPQVSAGYGLYKAGSQGNKILKFLKTKTGQEYYSKILNDSFAGNSTNLAKDMAKINDLAYEFEGKKPKQKWELLD